MEAAGRIIEDILKYIKAERSVKSEDIKERFGLEEEDAKQIIQFLVNLRLIRMDRNEVLQVSKEDNMVKLNLIEGYDHIKITESGLGFLQL